MTGGIGCYPGTFDPPTIAHVAVAEAAIRQCGLRRLDLVLSQDAIGKPSPSAPVDERVRALRELFDSMSMVRVGVTEHRLLADIARGYDVLVVGADKWAQVVDASFYESGRARDAAVASLPPVIACAPRDGSEMPTVTSARRVVHLDIDAALREVSSSAVRAGHPQADRWRARPSHDLG